MFNSFWKWVSVYLGCRCLRLCMTAKASNGGLGLGKAHQDWICNFFVVSSELCWEKGCNSGGWGHDCSGHPLTFTESSLPWSAAEISQMAEQVCQRLEIWQGWCRWRRKMFACRNCVYFGVKEILTRVTLVCSNGENFQSVIQWCIKMDRTATVDGILVYFWSHSGCVAVQCVTLLNPCK